MYLLECFECHNVFESTQDYTKRCPECRKPKKKVKKEKEKRVVMITEIVCDSCGKTFLPKRYGCSKVKSNCDDCYSVKKWWKANRCL